MQLLETLSTNNPTLISHSSLCVNLALLNDTSEDVSFATMSDSKKYCSDEAQHTEQMKSTTHPLEEKQLGVKNSIQNSLSLSR